MGSAWKRPILVCLWGSVVQFQGAKASQPHGTTAAEVLSIGMIDGPEEYTFGRIAAITVTAGGTIVVADQLARTVRAFDGEGRHLWSAGREGSGPGEFGHISAMASVADTIVVADGRLARLTVISADGEFVRTSPLPLHVGREGFITKFAPVEPGRYVAETITGCSLPRKDNYDNKWRLVLWSEGSADARILQEHTRTTVIAIYGDSFCSTMINPLGRTPLFDASPNGVIAIVDAGNSVAAMYERVGSDGPVGMSTEIRPSGAPPSISSAERELFQDSVVARQANPGNESGVLNERARRYMEFGKELELPETWPAIQNVLLDERGRAWLQRPLRFRDSFATWDRYTAGGPPEVTVVLPKDLEAKLFRGDAVYGLVQDELGVQYVKKLRITTNP